MEGLKTVFVKLGGKKSDLGIPASGAQLSFKVRRPSLSASERKGRSLTGVGTAQLGARLSGESWSGGASQTPVPPAHPAGSVHHNELFEFVFWASPGFLFLSLNELASSFPHLQLPLLHQIWREVEGKWNTKAHRAKRRKPAVRDCGTHA